MLGVKFRLEPFQFFPLCLEFGQESLSFCLVAFYLTPEFFKQTDPAPLAAQIPSSLSVPGSSI